MYPDARTGIDFHSLQFTRERSLRSCLRVHRLWAADLNTN